MAPLEEEIERYYRIARIYDGTSEIHRMGVANNVLKYGAETYDISV